MVTRAQTCIINFSNGVRKQFGVASWADTKCGYITGWYQPAPVMSWIKQNSNYGGGSGGGSSSGSSSNSYSRQNNNRYQQNQQQSRHQQNQQQNRHQQNQQQNRYSQQRATTSQNSNSGSNSQAAQRVKKELQKLRSQFDQMLALL